MGYCRFRIVSERADRDRSPAHSHEATNGFSLILISVIFAEFIRRDGST